MVSSPTRFSIDVEHQYLERCTTRKRGFPTKAAALNVAEQIMDAVQVNPGCHITPYPCPVCHEWHVTNRLIVFL